MTNTRKLAPEIFYHIYNRGFNKQTLFFEERDFERIYAIFERYKADEKYKNIKISAFCFLPNHFHLLLIDDNEPGLLKPGLRISEFLQRIQLSYAMYFNKKYGDKVKKGLKMPVFEGRFCAKEIFDENYLENLKNYIDWNAVKHEIVKSPEEWPFSSFEPKTKPGLLEPGLEKRNPKRWLDDFDPFFE